MRTPGNKTFQPLFAGLERLDPVMDVIDLAAAAQLGFDGLLHQRLVENTDKSRDRLAALGRALDRGEAFQTAERGGQCPGDRRRGQRQHIDCFPVSEKPFFVFNAKAVLFINNEKTQILEDDVRLDQAMRPDEDIDDPAADILNDLFLIGLVLKTREERDGDRVVGEAFRKSP